MCFVPSGGSEPAGSAWVQSARVQSARVQSAHTPSAGWAARIGARKGLGLGFRVSGVVCGPALAHEKMCACVCSSNDWLRAACGADIARRFGVHVDIRTADLTRSHSPSPFASPLIPRPHQVCSPHHHPDTLEASRVCSV